MQVWWWHADISRNLVSLKLMLFLSFIYIYSNYLQKRERLISVPLCENRCDVRINESQNLHIFHDNTPPGGGGGYSDLVWTGMWGWSLWTHTHVKGAWPDHFLTTRFTSTFWDFGTNRWFIFFSFTSWNLAFQNLVFARK